MDNMIGSHLAQLEPGELQRFGNLAIIPLLATVEDGPAYLTLQEAMAQGLLTVTEVAEGGSVPELKVLNRANLPVLLLDGEELTGAKQNRALNTTILLKEQTETIIPVSCTEHGRWSYTSREFSDSGTVMSRKIRTVRQESVRESLASSRSFRSDQGEVWREIAEMSEQAGAQSSTGAMRDVFERRRAELHEYLQAFPSMPRQAGLLVFVHGQAVGFDTVSLTSAYRVLHPKLVQSYAMDALLDRAKKGGQPSIKKAKAFLDEAAVCHGEAYPSVGYGTDYRFRGPRLVGSALFFDETVIHAAFFRTEQRTNEGRISGYQRRRGFRS